MKKLHIFLLAFALIQTTAAQDWQWQNPLPQGTSLNCVKFITPDTGYAVGYGGAIIKTTDGRSN